MDHSFDDQPKQVPAPVPADSTRASGELDSGPTAESGTADDLRLETPELQINHNLNRELAMAIDPAGVDEAREFAGKPVTPGYVFQDSQVVAGELMVATEDSRSTSKSVRPARPERDLGRTAFFFFLTVLCTFFALWFVGPKLVEEYYYAAELGRARGEYENAKAQLEQQRPLNEVTMAYQLVAQRIKPSVVSVIAEKQAKPGDGKTKPSVTMSGIGSGVIFSEDGHIVTNAHVVKDANDIRVELSNRHVYRARLVGIDSASDLAVLKIDAPDLIPATWGDSDTMDVGSIVWAIGNPFGFQQTVTSGVLSGKDRPGDSTHPKQSLLQTDAAVNPGNSGGPLVDDQGRVVGINTSIYGSRFQGISFAVPSSTAKFVFKELVRSGKVTRGYLGVYPAEVTPRHASIFELPDLQGARLLHVVKQSPAHRAGIATGDIIRSWNGQAIKDHRQLFRLSEATPPNTDVVLTVLRGGVEHEAVVTLGRLPADAIQVEPSKFSRGT